jgi:hypothetical protein
VGARKRAQQSPCKRHGTLVNTGIINIERCVAMKMESTTSIEESDPMSTVKGPRFEVSPTLADSLREAQASSFAEGVDTHADPAFREIKRRVLAGEMTVDQAVAMCNPAARRTVKV